MTAAARSQPSSLQTLGLPRHDRLARRARAARAVIGVESPGSYGRCLVAALAGAGFEVLQVAAWRTHRERHRRGPGKTDPGDALSVARVVRTKREDLGPAEEPELQRRRFVR